MQKTFSDAKCRGVSRRVVLSGHIRLYVYGGGGNGGPNIMYANELILFMHVITNRKWKKYNVYLCNIISILVWE